jgi:Ca2+-binding EF-hand superfamily protein
MTYCHSLRLIHKDLKDENVMLLRKDPNFDEPFAVVIDLGVAEMFSVADPTCREIAGTPSTMAPEVWSGKFGPKCDVWSLGCIFFELLAGSLPFNANTIQPGPWLKLAERGPNWNLVKTSPQSRMLCKAMLAFADKDRPTMKKVSQNAYFGLQQTKLKMVSHEQFSPLLRFASEQKAKRSLLLELAARLPMNRSQDIIELFEGLDVDRSGEIEEAELEEMFLKMGVEDKDLVHRTFEALDCNNDGSLSFSEFAAGALLLFKDMLEESFRAMFLGHDLDKNGGLEPEEAREFLNGVAAALNPSGDEPALVESLIAEVMAAGDGSKVTYEQLRDVVLGGTLGAAPGGPGAAAA